ncbi:hypothetical protein JRQ81_003777 [Phrynocephalus forsythii]|uniref:Ubiquitin-like protein 5 n=1 Tax=Phrynocephalus forsythii TaxID=171643 RepID=A0A9Q0XLH9_9SAUR|nr:hypothetical protein JRQ81_003777 [Phrynocephalus forsythii]
MRVLQPLSLPRLARCKTDGNHPPQGFISCDDTIRDLKKLIAAQTGTRWDKIVLKKWYTIFKDHVSLADCILKMS